MLTCPSPKSFDFCYSNGSLEMEDTPLHEYLSIEYRETGDKLVGSTHKTAPLGHQQSPKNDTVYVIHAEAHGDEVDGDDSKHSRPTGTADDNSGHDPSNPREVKQSPRVLEPASSNLA